MILSPQYEEDGDDAVLKLTQEFDKHPAKSMHELFVSANQLKAAFDGLADDVKHALQYAANGFLSFISIKSRQVFALPIILGNSLGQKSPLDRVGIYVPGRLASYPSSVLMNAIPAKVAGVGHITMVVPAPNGELNHFGTGGSICRVWIASLQLVGLRQWQHWHMVQIVLPK